MSMPGVRSVGQTLREIRHVERSGHSVEQPERGEKDRRGDQVDRDVLEGGLDLRAGPVQRHQHERRDQHHLEPDVQVEEVAGEEGARHAHQQDLDQRMIAERLRAADPRRRMPPPSPRRRRRRPRRTSMADEQIGDQRDAERRRPAAHLQHLDALGLDASEHDDGAGQQERPSPISAIHRCSSGRFGASSRMAAVIERHAGSAGPVLSSFPAHVVHIVGPDRGVDTMCEHQREGEQAEADHDRREDQRLRHRIGIRRQQPLLRRPARPAAVHASARRR